MLSKPRILQRLRDPEGNFAITPLLDEGQIGEASVDLRLGPDLIVIKRETGVVAFDPARANFADRLVEYQDYVRRPLGSPFYLHPREFAIARTLEYIALPNDVGATVAGRSSWGRLGLVIATATHIQTEFKGTITLELANLGTVPIVLYVGTRIAQLTLFAAD